MSAIVKQWTIQSLTRVNSKVIVTKIYSG